MMWKEMIGSIILHKVKRLYFLIQKQKICPIILVKIDIKRIYNVAMAKVDIIIFLCYSCIDGVNCQF